MKKLLSILFTLISLISLGQGNLQVQFGYSGSLAASKHLPASYNLDSNKFEINSSYNLWVGNSTLTIGSMMTIAQNNKLSNSDIDGIIDEMDDDNKFSFGQDFLVLGLGFSHMLGNKPLVWSAMINDRFLANAVYPRELPQLLWQGNKQFEGETVDLSSMFVTGRYIREFALGINREVYKNENISITAAMRLKYLMGIAGLNLEKNQIDFTTYENADSLKLDYNLAYNHTGITNFNLFEAKGHGYGIDIGTSVNIKNRLLFDLGLVDMGSITFDEATTSLNNDDVFVFDGLTSAQLNNPNAFLDSVSQILKADIGEGQGFNESLGVKLSFMASYKIKRNSRISKDKVFYFAYMQGFSESPGVTRTPKLSLAVHNVMFGVVDLGMNVSWGGFKKYSIGGVVGLKLRNFQFGIFSDDFTGFIAPDKATGAGAGIMIRYRF